MTRPPIVSGRLFVTGTNFQSAGTSSASLQRPSVPQISNAQAAYIEANEQAANIEANEQREQVAPVIRDIRVLHPLRRNGAKWFKNNTEVSTRVRKIIEGCFQGPWYNWKRVPAYYKETWYECDASIEHLVKANFDHLAATRLKGMVSLAKAKGKQPEWILSEHWRVMIDYWMTPKAKAKSEKARSSWLFSRDGLGAHCQRSGSSSYVKVQDALVANNEDSSFIAVMKKTHQKSDGTYVDERARLIAEKFDELVQERLSEMESPNGEVLTVDNLSRVFGLGLLQNGISMLLNGSTVSPQPTEEEVGTLAHRVDELESELKKNHDENLLLEKRLQAIEIAML
ncbi:unnamed protein product [Arabidopsis thaliana]|uniref:(thale cress) hypothetical protein n=1 Tax=Arabidopsis thaliana TaxID=3702 RepID=A0A7G2EPR9_ARATH|nr:unnamed protein product [Arabidopsis thaliana]